MINISDLVTILEFFGITRETFFPPLITSLLMYAFITKAFNTRFDALEKRISAIEFRIEHIEEYLQEISISLVEIQTTLRVKFREMRFEHKIKPYRRISESSHTQV